MTTFSLNLTFELFIDGVWVDFTRIDSVTKMLGDGKSGYTVSYGQPNESGKAPPMNVILKYQDNNGLLNEDNTSSPYYGKVAQYTRARISDGGFPDIVGEIASIVVDDTASQVVTLTITIGSVDRRLGQNQKRKPFHSPAYRALSAAENDADRLLYYPLEESKNANAATTPFTALGASVFTSGAFTFGDYTAHPASDRMVKLGTAGRFTFNVPDYTSTQHKTCALFNIPDSTAADTILYRWYCAGGNTGWIDLIYGNFSVGTLKLASYNFSGVLIDTANFIDWSANLINADVFLSIEFEQDGVDLDNTVLIVDQDLGNTGVANFDSLLNTNIGYITRVVVAQTDASGVSFGHFAMATNTGAFGNFISPTLGGEALGTRAFIGEPAGWRMFRLLTEQGVSSFGFYGDFDDTQRMGAQRKGVGLPELLADIQKADQGLMYCEKAINGDESLITYRAIRDMYNQAPRFTVDVSPDATVSQLSGSLKPTRDDQGRKNDVTITREGGAMYNFIIRDGDAFHYSTEDPPNGMSTVDAADTINLYTDSQAKLIAAWQAHLGSWRGPRFPRLAIDPWRAAVQNDAALVTGIADLIIGDVIEVNTAASISSWVPKPNFRVMTRGQQYTKAQMSHTINYNGIPAEAWEVEMTDSISSTLARAVDSDDIDFYFDTNAGPPWRLLSLTQVPFYMQVSGDVSKVLSVETLTPTFVAAGTPAHGNNASVSPGAPAGAAVGDLLVLLAAIRNQGTGTVTLPTGWTSISNALGNVRLMARYKDGTAADTPTVAFASGVANATTSACIMAFRNLSMRTTKVQTIFNGTTQNIGYQGYQIYPIGPHRYDNCVHIVAGWKGDDWTGVAPSSGFTEMLDSSSTTGDDQGIAAYYRIDTTATRVGNSQLVVTGGAVAANSGIAAAFRPLQHAEVTRNILSNAAAHSIGDFMRTWRPGVTGL